MKKMRVLALLAVMAMSVSMIGCGKEKEEEKEEPTRHEREEKDDDEEEEEEDDDELLGSDWRTWSAYKVMSWETPDYFEDLYFAIFDDVITVVHDYDEYTPVCDLEIGSVCDYSTVWDSLELYDFNGDGWDDIYVCDTSNDIYYDYYFLYDPDIDVFILDEGLSDLEGHEGESNGAGYVPTAYEQAFIPLLDAYDRDYDFCGYYLFNINPDCDDVYELIVEYSEDRTFEVYTVGLADDGTWVPVYVGDLAGSADYAYVTVDAYDGDEWDGRLTVNVCVEGYRTLYSYTMDSENTLYEEEVYTVEDEDYVLDGDMLERFDLDDWSPLETIDIMY